MSKTPAEIKYQNSRRMVCRQRPDLIADLLCIGEEQPSLWPQDQKAVQGFIIRVVGRFCPQDIFTAFASYHMHAWVGSLTGQAKQGQDDCHNDALQSAKNQHTPKRGKSPLEFHPSHLADRRKFGRLNQCGGIHDHDGGQNRLRQQSKQWRQHQHRRDRCSGCDQRCFLRPSADSAHHSGL